MAKNRVEVEKTKVVLKRDGKPPMTLRHVERKVPGTIPARQKRRQGRTPGITPKMPKLR